MTTTMRRFSDMAKEVSDAAQRVKPSASAITPPEPGPASPSRPALACHADGCLLAGAISEGTRGEGPWFCHHHFFAGKAAHDEVTMKLRNRLAAGLPLDEPQGASQTVMQFRESMRRAVRPTGGIE